MDNEKLKILEMVQEGKITSEEALELLNALQEPESRENKQLAARTSERFLRVRVNGTGNDVKKVDVNIPLSLFKVASKFVGVGMSCIPTEARRQMEEKGIDLSKIDFEELVSLMDQGLSDGKLVDVEVDEHTGGTIKVEVYVD